MSIYNRRINPIIFTHLLTTDMERMPGILFLAEFITPLPFGVKEARA
jgi:hypothetical protein